MQKWFSLLIITVFVGAFSWLSGSEPAMLISAWTLGVVCGAFTQAYGRQRVSVQ